MVIAVAGAASLYFISQSTAILYPNTAYFDPDFKPQTVWGFHLQSSSMWFICLRTLLRCASAAEESGER
jgi:hypothetical protein